MNKIRALVLTAVLIALAVSLSFLSFPVGISRCYPVQHLVNILCGVSLGPGYAVMQAVLTSTIRIALGTGTFLAYPGSVCGACLSAMGYRLTKKKEFALLGEVIGTGVIGALLAGFLAKFFLTKEAVFYAFLLPFGLSSLGGAVIAYLFLLALEKTKVLPRIRHSLRK